VAVRVSTTASAPLVAAEPESVRRTEDRAADPNHLRVQLAARRQRAIGSPVAVDDRDFLIAFEQPHDFRKGAEAMVCSIGHMAAALHLLGQETASVRVPQPARLEEAAQFRWLDDDHLTGGRIHG